jgi:hypothetical protein
MVLSQLHQIMCIADLRHACYQASPPAQTYIWIVSGANRPVLYLHQRAVVSVVQWQLAISFPARTTQIVPVISSSAGTRTQAYLIIGEKPNEK